jgi:hypothetical protein
MVTKKIGWQAARKGGGANDRWEAIRDIPGYRNKDSRWIQTLKMIFALSSSSSPNLFSS